jgi:hypothetical protein
MIVGGAVSIFFMPRFSDALKEEKEQHPDNGRAQFFSVFSRVTFGSHLSLLAFGSVGAIAGLLIWAIWKALA